MTDNSEPHVPIRRRLIFFPKVAYLPSLSSRSVYIRKISHPLVKMKQDYIVPKWLNEAFLVKVMSEKCEQQFKIKEFSIDSATQKGDNYASEMFRIVVKYELLANQGLILIQNLILKKNHSDPKINEIFQPSDMYRKEINCYRIYLPEFQKLLQSIGVEAKLAPEVIYYDLENEVLVMEDMAVQNYRTAEKSTRFSMGLARQTLRKLALYHAASVIYNERANGELEGVKNTIFSSGVFNDMFETILGAATAEVQSWGAEYEKYLGDLQFIRDNFLAIANNSLVPSDGMGVFMHGDMWLNNLLVQYGDNKSAKDILLIDFQLSGWASRAVDLIYFVFTTLNEEDYMNHFDEVLQIYNEEFSATLKKFDYKAIPSFSEFQQEVQKKLPYGE